MVDNRTITAQICACFEALARIQAPSSSLGALISGSPGLSHSQRVAAGSHDLGVVRPLDRVALFRHCSPEDLAVLVEKYHNSPEQRDVTRRVPGKSHGFVRVGYRCTTFQSDASCAKALGLRSAHSFKRKLTRARDNVRRALQEQLAA